MTKNIVPKSLILFGKFGPAFLTLSRFYHDNGAKVYLLEINKKNLIWRKKSSCLSGGEIIPEDIVYTKEGIEYINRY